MGFFDKLKNAQENWDEGWINKTKEVWKKRFKDLSPEELEQKLAKLEGKFDSRKSSSHVFWFGAFGAAEHVSDREKESQRRAIKELLQDQQSFMK